MKWRSENIGYVCPTFDDIINVYDNTSFSYTIMKRTLCNQSPSTLNTFRNEFFDLWFARWKTYQQRSVF